jgi:hypothetical protein
MQTLELFAGFAHQGQAVLPAACTCKELAGTLARSLQDTGIGDFVHAQLL